MISTRFSREYNVEFPFASAGIGFFGLSELAIAVCQAGGIGTIGVGLLSPEILRGQIKIVKKATGKPLNVNFITFLATEAHIHVCIEEQVEIVSFHWGAPSPEFIKLLKKAGIKIWEQVGSVETARKAVGNGIDLIIAQGIEAGGHNYSTLPTFVLVPEIVEAVAPTLVLAAGGITTGKQVAAALCLGADGVWVGTRLVASNEAYAHPYYKERLVKANGIDTRLDHSFGPEWPQFNPTRLLENELTLEYRGREQLLPTSTQNEPVFGKATYFGEEYILRRFNNFLPVPEIDGNVEWMPLLSGQGVGMIKDIQPAGQIIRTMMNEADETLNNIYKK